MRRLPNCVQIGRGNKFIRPPVPRIDKCLSEPQIAKLKIGKKIACGSFACAYEQKGRPDRVVKITQDPTDVEALRLGQGDPRVVKMHEAYRLTPGHKRWVPSERASAETEIYAVVVDRLLPAPKGIGRIIRRVPGHWLKQVYNNSDHAGTPEYEIPLVTRERMVKDACEYGDRKGSKQRVCRRIANEAIDLHERLGRKGVNLSDLHGGNIGIKPRFGWQMIDVGYSESGAPQVPDLAGVGRYSRIGKRRRRSR